MNINMTMKQYADVLLRLREWLRSVFTVSVSFDRYQWRRSPIQYFHLKPAERVVAAVVSLALHLTTHSQ